MYQFKKAVAVVAAAALAACGTEPLSTPVPNGRGASAPRGSIYPAWQYRASVLLPGQTALARDVNDFNEIVGYTNGEAFWMPLGGSHRLLAHPGSTGANAAVISSRSSIGGAVIRGNVYYPAVWSDPAANPIELPRPGNVMGMNSRSEAVGWTTVRGIVRAFYWEAATNAYIPLPRYATGNDDFAWAINNDRTVVGTSGGFPVMWREANGTWTVTRIFGIFPTDIDAGYGTVGGDGFGHASYGKPSLAGAFGTQWLGSTWAVNGRGEAVGEDWNTTTNQVLAWVADRSGGFTYLPFPSGSPYSTASARGINTCGLIVGYLGASFASEAVVWDPGC